MKGSKWIPIYGMFTEDADNIPNSDIDLTMLMIVYHSVIAVAMIFGIVLLIIKISLRLQ